jgi:competence ComEA-like helix-hairpin-helix protein
MNFFRPAEIRAILILSALVFIGSSLTLFKRQGRLSSLELGAFLNNDRYNYSYNIADFSKEKTETAARPIEENALITENDSTKKNIIDLNSAGYFDLQTLPGIGPVLAERIMAYRDSIGAFRSEEELLNITGIGDNKYAEIKDRITVR